MKLLDQFIAPVLTRVQKIFSSAVAPEARAHVVLSLTVPEGTEMTASAEPVRPPHRLAEASDGATADCTGVLQSYAAPQGGPVVRIDNTATAKAGTKGQRAASGESGQIALVFTGPGRGPIAMTCDLALIAEAVSAPATQGYGAAKVECVLVDDRNRVVDSFALSTVVGQEPMRLAPQSRPIRVAMNTSQTRRVFTLSYSTMAKAGIV